MFGRSCARIRAPWPDLLREDFAATLAARRELGEESDRELVDSFLDRVEPESDARVDARLARLERAPAPRSGGGPSVLLALGSMGIGIGVTGAANGMAHGGALVAIIAWIAIAAINVAHALGR